MDEQNPDQGLISGFLIRSLRWLRERAAIRLHHLVAFVGIQAVSWSMVILAIQAVNENSYLFESLGTGPFSYFSIGGLLVIYTLLAILSLAGLLYGPVQIFYSAILLLVQAIAFSILGPFEQWVAYRSIDRNVLEVAIGTWGPRLLFLALLVSLVLFLVGLVKKFSRRVDVWMASRSPSLLKEDHLAPGVAQTTSILAVVALLLSFVIPILGILLGYVALNDIAVSSGTKRGKDLAVAAIIIGIGSIVLIALLIAALWALGTLAFIGPFAPQF